MLYSCVGNYAKNPYYLDELGAYIYSIEELCYYLKENITGLESTLMTYKLCQFIGRELGLDKLAWELNDIINRGQSLAKFVTCILFAAGYCSKDELAEIEKLLHENASMSPGMRRKLRGDYFVSQGRYVKAVREYKMALVEEGVQEAVQSLIYHNMGCAFARMFFFNEAADYFKKSYEIDGNTESYEQYLAALRIGGSREKYVQQIIDLELDQEKVAALEDRIGALAVESREAEEYLNIQKAIDDKNAGDMTSFNLGVANMIKEWKDEYRRNMEAD